jgi:soluble lytic murein transglycosylase-like protein
MAVPAMASDIAILNNGFSILHTRREVVGPVTRLYTGNDSSSYVDIDTSQINHFEHDSSLSLLPATARSQTTAEAQPDLNQVINSISGRHHIDPDFVNSVIHAESGFNQHAVSAKGAQGLMQLMPQTATQLGVADAFNPSDNVEGGTRYLRELLERYDFNVVKALAAYNAGPHRVEQYRGVPPYAETRAYVARIIRDFNQRKLAEKKAAATTAKSARATTRAASLAPSAPTIKPLP